MRLVVLSDTHCHAWAAFSSLTESGINARLQDTLQVFDHVRRLAIEFRADAIVFAGDLFHVQKIDAEVLALTSNALEALGTVGVPILAIEGNHDQAARVRQLTSTSALRVPANWKWLRDEVVNVKGTLIWGASFGHKGLPPTPVDIAIMHRGILGAEVSDYFISPFEDDLDPDKAKDYARRLVICGHYHKPQLIEGTPTLLVPGAPLQHTWSDAGQDRGIWTVEITASTVNPTFVPLPFPKFIRVSEPKDISQVPGNFVEVDCKGFDVSNINSARSIAVKASDPVATRPVADRIQIGTDLEAAVRAYVEKFGQNDEALKKLGLDLLNRASISH